ncbi:MAG: hypothetical protein MUF01_00940, partial [Bryobacterales bacterium]|nr:hypothetical protein [Bryobacterales bacterium]
SQATDGQLHPLCAVYRARAATGLERLLEAALEPEGRGTASARAVRAPSMHRFLDALSYHTAQPTDPRILWNVNTMQEYLAALRGVETLEPPCRERARGSRFGKAARDGAQ